MHRRAGNCFVLVVVAAIVATLQAGCSKGGETPPAAGDSGTRTITIGLPDSLTGGLSAQGSDLYRATLVAAQQINQVGILGGQQVIFDVRDDTSDPAQSRAVVQSLLGEGVAGILGPISSGEVQNVQDLAYGAKVVELTASATSTLLTGDQPPNDRYLFRTAPPDSLQGRAIVRFIRDGIAMQTGDGGDAGTVGGSCRTTVIVNGDDAYGTSLGEIVEQTFVSSTSQVLKRDEVPTALQSNYSAAVGDVVREHPDCVVLVVYSDVGAEFLRELGQAIAADTNATGHDWSKFYVCGADGEYDANFIVDGRSDPGDSASRNSTASCYGTAPDTAPSTPEYEAFRRIWQESYPGTEPPPYGANQYDATLLLALAIARAGTATDGTAIRDALLDVATPPGISFGPADFTGALLAIANGEDIDYNGASGNCDFDADGDVATDYIVWQVQRQPDGTFAFVTVGGISTAEL